MADKGVSAGGGRVIIWARRLAPVFSVAIFITALALLHRMLGRFHVADVVAQLARIPPEAILLAACFTAGSYCALAGFDGLGAHYIGKKLAPARILLISFVSHAISHSAGFATLTGGAIRLRMYTAAGLSAAEVAAVVAFCGLTFGLGASGVAAVALLTEPELLAMVLHLPAVLLRGLGAGLALVIVAYVCWGASGKRAFHLFGRTYAVPRPQLAALQIGVAALDLALASAVLFVLLPRGTSLTYPSFLGAYVVANLLGLLAHVPGGLGVFDAAILVLTPELPPDAVLGALLLFRVFYNLLPLALAAILLLLFEVLERVPGVGRRVGGLFDELGPPLLAMSVFAAGGLTIFAHALPDSADVVPQVDQALGMAETAIACLLMVFARGLNRRNPQARRLACILLGLLAILVLVQTPLAPRAIGLAVLAVIVGLASHLSDQANRSPPPMPSLPWGLAIGAILAVAAWMTGWVAHTRLLSTEALRPALLADLTAVLVFAAVLAFCLLRGRLPH